MVLGRKGKDKHYSVDQMGFGSVSKGGTGVDKGVEIDVDVDEFSNTFEGNVGNTYAAETSNQAGTGGKGTGKDDEEDDDKELWSNLCKGGSWLALKGIMISALVFSCISGGSVIVSSGNLDTVELIGAILIAVGVVVCGMFCTNLCCGCCCGAKLFRKKRVGGVCGGNDVEDEKEFSVDEVFVLRRLNNRFKTRQLEKLMSQNPIVLTPYSRKLLIGKAREESKSKLNKAKQESRDKERELRELLRSGDQVSSKLARSVVRPILFVINFDGDIMASDVHMLRDQISLVIEAAGVRDEVLVLVNSPGGAAHLYGLAAAELERFRKAEIHLTVAVDQIAASGGYMMASVADKIISAPFAIVGSIGVITFIPNVEEALNRVGVKTYVLTSGRYKNTVGPVGPVTEEGEQKVLMELEEIHQIFKNHVSKYRPHMDIENIATGEAYSGLQGLENGLVDELMTSDEYIMSKMETHDVIEVALRPKTSGLFDGLFNGPGLRLSNFPTRIGQWFSRLRQHGFFASAFSTSNDNNIVGNHAQNHHYSPVATVPPSSPSIV